MDYTSDFDYHTNKRPDRVYLSKKLKHESLPTGEEQYEPVKRDIRIVSKVLDVPEQHEFIKEGHQVKLRVTGLNRQEIIAKFYEDTRGIFSLQIQKFTDHGGNLGVFLYFQKKPNP